MTKIKSLLKLIASNPTAMRAIHTSWQAAAGAFVAALSGTHGDVRSAIVVAVAAALAAVRTLVIPAKAPAVTVADSPPAPPVAK